jgi:type IX secretion system PorP/SprF family membrane protein
MKPIRKIRYSAALVTIIFNMAVICPISAQDPQLSQFYSTPLYLGPSFAGSTGMTRVGMNIRAQWIQVPGSFITSSAYADKYFEKYKLGTGVSVMYDDAGGLMSSLYLATQYSYRISLGKKAFFVPGIQAQYFSKKINTEALTFSDQIFNGEVMPTTIENLDNNKYHHFDFALSGLIFSDRYWFGFTGNHLMKINQNLPEYQDFASLLFSAYGGMTFDLNDARHISRAEKSLTATFYYKTQDQMHQLDLGMYLTNHPYMLGIWYRGLPLFSDTYNKDALTLLAGIQVGSLSIAYSYDITLSKLVNTTGGSHEISAVYKLSNPNGKNRRIHAVPCPHF